MKGTIKDAGGIPSGEVMRDLRREAERASPVGESFDVTTRGTSIPARRRFGAKRVRYDGPFAVTAQADREGVDISQGYVLAGNTAAFSYDAEDVAPWGVDADYHLALRVTVDVYYGYFTADAKPTLVAIEATSAAVRAARSGEYIDVLLADVTITSGKVYVTRQRWRAGDIYAPVRHESDKSWVVDGDWRVSEWRCYVGLQSYRDTDQGSGGSGMPRFSALTSVGPQYTLEAHRVKSNAVIPTEVYE